MGLREGCKTIPNLQSSFSIVLNGYLGIQLVCRQQAIPCKRTPHKQNILISDNKKPLLKGWQWRMHPPTKKPLQMSPTPQFCAFRQRPRKHKQHKSARNRRPWCQDPAKIAISQSMLLMVDVQGNPKIVHVSKFQADQDLPRCCQISRISLRVQGARQHGANSN